MLSIGLQRYERGPNEASGSSPLGPLKDRASHDSRSASSLLEPGAFFVHEIELNPIGSGCWDLNRYVECARGLGHQEFFDGHPRIVKPNHSKRFTFEPLDVITEVDLVGASTCPGGWTLVCDLQTKDRNLTANDLHNRRSGFEDRSIVGD